MSQDPRRAAARASRRELGLVAALALALPIAGAAARPAADRQKPPLWQVLEKLAAAKKVRAEFDVVLADVASALTTQPVRGRLKRVERGLTEPWSVPELARALRDPLAASVAAKS